MKTQGAVLLAGIAILGWATARGQVRFNIWEPTNGPLGGYVRQVAIYPSNPNKIVASSDSGIYLTTNGGVRWDSLSRQSVEAILIASTNPNTIYFVTGSGITKSTDDGITWSTLSTPRIHSLVAGPQGPLWLYGCGDSGRVHVSSNGGTSWQTRNVGSIRTVTAIAVHPFANLIFAGTGGDFDFPGDGVFRSTDGGITWSNSALPNKTVGCIVFDPSNSSTTYIGTIAGGMYFGSGVFKSTNNGGSWFGVSVGMPADSSVLALLVNPLVPQQIYAALEYNGLYKTENGGASWFHVNANIDEGYALCLATAPSDMQRVYVGTDLGLLRGSYSASNLDLIGVSPVAINSVVIDPSRYNVVYAIGRGVYMTSDEGESWKLTNKGLGGGEVIAIDPSNPNVLYAGQYSPYGAVYKSTDAGIRWTVTALTDVAINAIAIDPITPRIVYAGGLLDPLVIGMFRTTDGGTSWDTLRSGIAGGAVTAIATNRAEPSTLYIGTNGGGVLKSTNSGDSWFQVNQGLPQSLGYIGDLTIDPVHPDTAHAGIQGVYRTTNGGNSWDSVNTGLTDRDVRALALDYTQPPWVYAGTWAGGAFWNFTGGNSWSQMNYGERVERITSFSLCPQRVLYAGTGRDGAWRYRFLICSVADESTSPLHAVLQQNYPNPFNPATRIEYSVPKNSHVSLRVFDVLGREVATLVEGIQDVGFKSVKFDGSGLASGVYFYQLITADLLATKRMLIIK